MRTETRYVCETCGTRYASRRLAEVCEATVLPSCPVGPGDAVSVRERYDGLQPDVVAEVAVAASPSACMMADLDDGHQTVERHLANAVARPLHIWLVRLGQRHQMGKDEFTDEVRLSDLAIGGRPLADVA